MCEWCRVHRSLFVHAFGWADVWSCSDGDRLIWVIQVLKGAYSAEANWEGSGTFRIWTSHLKSRFQVCFHHSSLWDSSDTYLNFGEIWTWSYQPEYESYNQTKKRFELKWNMSIQLTCYNCSEMPFPVTVMVPRIRFLPIYDIVEDCLKRGTGFKASITEDYNESQFIARTTWIVPFGS